MRTSVAGAARGRSGARARLPPARGRAPRGGRVRAGPGGDREPAGAAPGGFRFEHAGEGEGEVTRGDLRGFLDDADEDAEAGPPAGGLADPLEDWQLVKLEAAHRKGRRKIQVSAVAAEVRLSRPEVLGWLKARKAMPAGEAATLRALEAATRERQAVLDAAAASRPAAPEPGLSYRERLREGMGDKRIPFKAIRTMEMVYQRSPWPSERVIHDCARLGKLPPQKVREWFKEKRQSDRHTRLHPDEAEEEQ